MMAELIAAAALAVDAVGEVGAAPLPDAAAAPIVAPADDLARPQALAAALAKFGHRVRWRAAAKDASPVAGWIAWPKRSRTNRRAPDDAGHDALEVIDLGSAEAAAVQADSAAAIESPAGFHAVYVGRWCYSGDAMRVGILADCLRELALAGRVVTVPRR